MARFGSRLGCVFLHVILSALRFTESNQQDTEVARQKIYRQLPNTKLRTSSKLLETLSAINQLSCAHACLKTTRCLSFDVSILLSENGQHVCQLYAVRADNANIQASREFHHFTTLVRSSRFLLLVTSMEMARFIQTDFNFRITMLSL